MSDQNSNIIDIENYVIHDVEEKEVENNNASVVETNTQEVKQEVSEAFTVTPENYVEGDNSNVSVEKGNDIDHKVNKLNFKKTAQNDGYSDSVIEKALELTDDSISTYADFEKLINKVITEFENEQRELEQKTDRIKRSVDMELAKLVKIKDIATYADSLIRSVYETSAVIAMDLIKKATPEELNLELYKEPIYSVILQINKSWVQEKVASILASWETRDYPRMFVESYLKSLGVPEEDYIKNKQSLISYLPENIQKEKSPDTYKQFTAVKLIYQHNDPKESVDLSDKIFKETMRIIEFDATLQKEMEEGTPALAATACATEAAIEAMPEEEKSRIKPINIAGAAGSFCGKIVSFKYETAKNFDDMMRESMGEYGDAWLANREAARARKEELKQRKAELKQEAAIRKEELKAEEKERRQERKLEERQYRQQQQMYNSNYSQGYDRRRQGNYNKGYKNNYNKGYTNRNYSGRNFAPSIPLPLIVAAINVIVGLIIWAIFGKSIALFSCIGLIMSFVGFLKANYSEPGAIPTVLLGYGITAIAVLVSLK